MTKPITREEIEAIQVKWGESLVNIGKIYLEKGDYRILAKNHISNFYGYNEDDVLFKPTMANNQQFRNTFDSALSYFIGENKAFPNDIGFALVPWKEVRFENAGFLLHDFFAVAMGNYFFTNMQGEVSKVEYTFGYFRAKNGELKINLHHSSIPYPKN